MRLANSSLFAVTILLTGTACLAQWSGAGGGRGFLCNPPVYVSNERDFPLTGLGVIMPGPGETVPVVDVSGEDADRWNVNGENAQPGLTLETNWIRAGALRGFKGGWAAGISVPWYRNVIKGSIGGQPANGVAQGFGNIALAAKKVVWEDCTTGRRLILGFGIELPTGTDDARFGPDNAVTNGYFNSPPRRIPLGWQPSTGTFNGLFTLAYGRTWERLAWQGLVAAKINGTDDEDVKVGNVFIASLQGTYGISRDLAGSLGFTLRGQDDDDYPISPLPVNGLALQGTTSHSTFLYLDASLRYTVMRKITVGVGVRVPITTPDQGMDPDPIFSVIFYPNTD